MSEKIITVLKWIGIIYIELFFILAAIGVPAMLIWVTIECFVECDILFGIITAFLVPAGFCVSIVVSVIAIEFIKNQIS